MTDNASEFRAGAFEDTLFRLGVRHTFIHAGRPQTNGAVERVQGTILQECWKPTFARYLIVKLTGLQRELVTYLKYYNEDRAHHARDVANLISLIDAAPAIVIGQSIGGVIAYCLAATRPHVVRALIVIEADVSKREEHELAKTVAWLRSWPVPFESRATAEGFFKGEGIYSQTWASLLEGRQDGLWPAFDVQVLEQTLRAVAGDDRHQWARVTCQTLVVAGGDGFADKAEMQDMASAKGVYKEVPGAGHDLHLEAPSQWRVIADLSSTVCSQSC